MWRDAGRFGEDCDVDIAHLSAAPGNELYRLGEEDGGWGVLPLRVARRKVRAYVAFADGAKYCIGERVKCRVGVGMTSQSVGVFDTHPAQHYMISLREWMNVDAHAGPDIGQIVQSRRKQPVGLDEVGSSRHLAVFCCAGDDRNFEPGKFRHRGI